MESKEFKGKTAVITGAASGMGRCLAETFCATGGNAILCDINAESVDAVAAEISAKGRGMAWACVTDVRRYVDAERAAELALEKTGRIDMLFNFAGGWEPRMCNSMVPFHEQPVEVIDWGLDVNLRGPVYMTRACMPAMLKAKSGVICCVGSVNGAYGDAMGPMYGASKSGLFNFVKSITLDGAKSGVRAFCVAPGPVMTRPGMAAMSMDTPIGRGATPQEVVDFILYLSSEKGSFVAGSTHFIDGGFVAMRPKP